MSDETPTAATEPTDVDEAPEDAQTEDSTPDATDQDAPEPQSKREARYRTQLREAEVQRDALAATVEAMQRREVERLAGTELAKGEAIWAAGTELADLRDESGSVSAELVTAAAQSAKQTLGLAAAWKAPSVPREGTSYDRSTPPNTWESAFKQQ